jgi:hypothetical protein
LANGDLSSPGIALQQSPTGWQKKAKSSKRKIESREPYKRRSEAEKQKIVYEVTKGLIRIRAACRKYGVNCKRPVSLIYH